MSQSHGHDLFGGKDIRADGADPRAEMAPDGRSAEKRYDLKDPLGDEAVLNMTVVGGEFPTDLIAVLGGLAMEVLVTGPARAWCHGGHPEVITVGADGVDGLFEGHLDFEANSIEFDDLDGGVQAQVGAKKYFASPVGMDDPDEADEAANRSP